MNTLIEFMDFKLYKGMEHIFRVFIAETRNRLSMILKILFSVERFIGERLRLNVGTF